MFGYAATRRRTPVGVRGKGKRKEASLPVDPEPEPAPAPSLNGNGVMCSKFSLALVGGAPPAWAIAVSPNVDASDAIAALSFPRPRALLLSIGGASNLSPEKRDALQGLYSGDIAQFVIECGASVITGGTKSGVMEMMGEGVSKVQPRLQSSSSRPSTANGRVVLLGILPKNKVQYEGQDHPRSSDAVPLEPNHTHFVLVDVDEWGGETGTLFRIANALAVQTVADGPSQNGDAEGASDEGEQATKKRRLRGPRVVTLLSNGGLVSKAEAHAAVVSGWPLIVIRGSGRLADDIVQLAESRTPREAIEDPLLRDIVHWSQLHIFDIASPAGQLKRLLASLVGDGEPAVQRSATPRR